MQIVEVQRSALRVTRAGDTFYNRPLAEITLFRMTVDRAEVEPHTGAFSLKTVLGGSERYDFARRSLRVHVGQSLLVNAGETYASEIEGPCCSLAIFYRSADVASAARALSDDPPHLLDRPYEDGHRPEVAQIILEQGHALRDKLAQLVRTMNQSDAEDVEAASRAVLESALSQSLGLFPPRALADIVKRSTRDELLGRVLRARTAIYDRQGQDCALDELAALACLSKFHFLRVFAEAFGETPLAMARRIRLESAIRALKSGAPLPSVARQAGFRSLNAFRRALRRL